jgi:IMP dehydrogenase/GMP reductase
VKWCARVATKPIVADGGIRHHGDIAKSIRFGASMVMIGSLFAGHEESPGDTVVEVDGQRYKAYFGSATDFNKGERTPRRGQAHPRAHQGPAGRHPASRCARTCRAPSPTPAGAS